MDRSQYLVKRLAGAPKCRAVDDLFMLIERHPRYCKLRLELASGSMAESMELLRNGTTLEERALAIWSSNAFLREGHSKRSSRDPFQLFEHFKFLGVPPEVVAICEQGYRKSRETLPLMFGLIYQNKPSTGDVMDDHLPDERILHGVPMFAVDYFCREGREAYRQFLHTGCQFALNSDPHFASNSGSDSISMKFGGGVVLFSERNQYHAAIVPDFAPKSRWTCCAEGGPH